MKRSLYHIGLLELDMRLKGWINADLARAAKVSPPTLTRFLRGEIQSARTAAKLAKALGQPLSRYVVSEERRAS